MSALPVLEAGREIEVLAGALLPRALTACSMHPPQPPASGGIPWLIAAPTPSLPPSSHGDLPVLVTVSEAPFHKDSSHLGLGAYPPPG